jgi:hypothetical protein
VDRAHAPAPRPPRAAGQIEFLDTEIEQVERLIASEALASLARKLAVLFYLMLCRDQDYAHQQPSLTALKPRRLKLTAGAPTRKREPSGMWATRERMREAEKQLAQTGRGLIQALQSPTGAQPPTRRRARA